MEKIKSFLESISFIRHKPTKRIDFLSVKESTRAGNISFRCILSDRSIFVLTLESNRIEISINKDVIFSRVTQDYVNAVNKALEYKYGEITFNEANVVDDITELRDEDGEKLDPAIWGIEKIVSVVQADSIEEAASSTPLMTDSVPKNVKRGDTLYITAILAPKDKSLAYEPGKLGVLKVRVIDLFYNTSVLKYVK